MAFVDRSSPYSNEENVTSSKIHTQPKTRVQKSYPIYDRQNG